MLSRLFPQRFDNQFLGRTAALWIFGLLVTLKILQSVNVMFRPHDIAISADGIPLSTYSAAAAASITGMFSLLGLAQLMLWTICVIALICYRAMVPLLYCLMVLHYTAARGLLLLHPIERAGPQPGVYVNMVAFGLMLLGLVLSLTSKSGSASRSTAANQ